MTKKLCVAIFVLFLHGSGFAKGAYWVTSFGDLLFQFSTVESDQVHLNQRMRFTGWFHVGQYKHYDLTPNFGFYYGSNVRNVGLIYTYTDGEDEHKIKRRAYTAGVPLVFKLGDLDENKFFYLGAEAEVAFHYKQKDIVNSGSKSIEKEWFSSRVNIIQPSVIFGRQFKGGLDLGFKWYLRDFINSGYNGKDFGNKVDYRGFKSSQIFYVALSWKIKSGTITSELRNKEETKFAVY